METSSGWGGSVEEVARIAQELEAEGVRARVVPEPAGPGWDPVTDPLPGPVPAATAALEYRNGDAEVVARKLRQHGVRGP
jgi:hypothetical protein